MNWKLIWKYTGKIFAATFFVWFLSGFLTAIFFRTGYTMSSALVVFAGLATLAVVIFIFAKLSLEQRERTNVHASAVYLLCALIPLPLNVFLFGQSILEWTLGNVVFLGTAAVGLGVGAFLRPRELKSEAEAPRFVEIKETDARAKTGKIQICLSCAAENRLSKALLIGLKPVCGKCGGALRDLIRPAEFIDSEYVDVDSAAFRHDGWKTNVYQPQSARAEEIYERQNFAPTAQNFSAPYEEKADDELMNKLFLRLLGDREKALRIVNFLKRNHPARSERWCWEKAVEDIDRDRR